MGLPDRSGPHDGEIPSDDEAVGIARNKARIAPDECCRMDLDLVPSQDRFGLQWPPTVVVGGGH